MTYLEKLTDLVCQEKDIEKDLKELRFWCKIKSWKNIHIITNIEWWWKTNAPFLDTRYVRCTPYLNFQFDIKQKEKIKLLSDDWKWVEIIWNPLELHHLMLYCSKKWWPFTIGSQWRMMWNKQKDWSYYEIQLDNKKPLHQQSEEVLKNIFEALAS